MSPRPPRAGAAAVAAAPAPVPDDGAEGKFIRTGVKRENGFLYFLKAGGVWRKALKGGEATLVVDCGLVMDIENYLYYVDADGDIARKRRQR